MRQPINFKLVLIFAAFIASGLRAAATFTPLGDLPGGNFFTEPYAISADGTAVTGQGHGTNGYQTFLWTAATGIQGIGPTSASNFPGGIAVANGGSVVYGVDSDHWFRWTQSTGLTNLATQSLSRVGATYRAGTSPDGSLGVASLGVDPGHSFKWSSAGGTQALTAMALVRDVTPDGSTYCGWNTANHPSVYRPGSGWGGGTDVMEIATSGAAFDLSDNGDVVVGFTSSQAYRWTQATGVQQLGFLPLTNASYALSCSGDGNVIVGGTMATGANGQAFIWDAAHGIRSLKSALLNEYGIDVATWQLNRAEGISSNGFVIAGVGTNPSGQSEGWIVALPEPSMITSVALVVAALSRRRARAGR